MNRSNSLFVALGLGLMLGLFAGCGDKKQAKVHGTVTYNGIPVEEGSISFFPEPGTESRKASAAILDGAFDIPTDRGPFPGKFRVEITGVKKTGKKIPSADPGIEIDERIELIPDKYHRNSTLIREIAPGDNKLDFLLDP